MKKRFIVEIEVDEKNIAKKYPNYNFNWNTPEEFIKSLMSCFTNEADTNMAKDGLKKFGYAKRIIKEVKK